jgi:flagellar basal-body rod protein FlgB
MWFKALETPARRSMERAMDYAALRAEVLTNNLANVNTPNYKRMDVDFSTVLAETMAEKPLPLTQTNAKHMTGSIPPLENMAQTAKHRIVVDSSTKERFDGNNVNVEFEEAQITENSMYFQSLSQMWRKEMNKLKMAIEGRS